MKEQSTTHAWTTDLCGKTILRITLTIWIFDYSVLCSRPRSSLPFERTCKTKAHNLRARYKGAQTTKRNTPPSSRWKGSNEQDLLIIKLSLNYYFKWPTSWKTHLTTKIVSTIFRSSTISNLLVHQSHLIHINSHSSHTRLIHPHSYIYKIIKGNAS